MKEEQKKEYFAKRFMDKIFNFSEKYLTWRNIISSAFLLFFTAFCVVAVIFKAYYVAVVNFIFALDVVTTWLLMTDRDEWATLAQDAMELLKKSNQKFKLMEVENFIMTATLNGNSYVLVEKKLKGESVGKGIWCLKCHLTSWNENDVEKKYCGNCHIFHEDEKVLGEIIESVKAAGGKGRSKKGTKKDGTKAPKKDTKGKARKTA